MHTSNKFQVSIYSFWIFQVKLSQTKKFSQVIRLAHLEQSTSCTNKTRYVPMMHKRAIFSSFKKNTEVIIFPKAHWKVRVRVTNSDYVI